MNPETLIKAEQTVGLLADDLQELLNDSNEEPFAALMVLDLIRDVAAVQSRITLMIEAARYRDTAQG